MLKKELRRYYKSKRAQITNTQRDDWSMQIANQLLTLPIWNHLYFHLFLTIEKQREVQTEYILHILHAKDKEVVVSKSNFDNCEMTHFLLTDNTALKTNAYHIPEPIDGLEVPTNKLDVVFIPLLAFDSTGNRVGYGKGFYDRMLQQCSPNTKKIGLSFFEASETISDVNANDITLDYCVTPNTIYQF
ncbi:MAG: 5-formyltetrahydrofolate cyclo-ligase [Flavobacteriaceae bacterium]